MKVGEVKPTGEQVEIQYNRAMEAYTRRKYGEASELFKYVIQNADSRELRAKSQFYMGEIYKSGERYGTALIYYAQANSLGLSTEDFIQEVAPNSDIKSLETALKYIKSDLRAYILYITARKYQAEGKEREGDRIFQTIVREYPETIYARKARYMEKTKGKAKIGVLLPLTGSYTEIGNSIKRGIEIGSRDKFVPVFADTKGNPLIAYREAVRLIKKEKVSGIIGPLLSLNSFAIACLTEYLEIPLISPTATKALIDSVGESSYMINRTLPMQARAMANYATNELGVETFAIMYPETDYGKALERNFRKEVEQKGGNVLSSISYREGDPDFKDELRTIKENNPQAIYVPAMTDDIPLIAPQLKYFKLKSQILGADGWKSPDIFRQIDSSYLDGVVLTGYPYSPGSNFIRRFDYVYREDPNRYAALGYDSASLMEFLIENPGTDPGDADINFIAGSIVDEGDYSMVPFYIINNGEFESLK